MHRAYSIRAFQYIQDIAVLLKQGKRRQEGGKEAATICGRFAFWVTRRRLKEEFDLPVPKEALPKLPVRFNITPGTDIASIRQPPESPRELAMLHWGLIPSWAKDKKTGYKMINARAKSVMKRPAFRNAFRYKRCLI